MAKKVKKIDEVVKEETLEEQPIEEPTEVTEEVVQAVANAIVEEATEKGKEIKEVVDEIVEETTEAELPKVEFNEEVAPKSYSGLVQPQKQNDELKMKDGKIYKEIGNGLGMFLNDGTTFRI